MANDSGLCSDMKKMDPTVRTHVLILATALAGWFAGPSAARVWTSSSGHTVEAELAGREGDFVILQRENGSQIKIHVGDLALVDQDHLNAQEQAPPSPTPESDPSRVFGPVAFQAPPALTTDQLPGVTPQVPDNAGYLGLQFGSSPADVLYLVVDVVDPSELPRHIFLYAPNHPVYGTAQPVAARRGKWEENRVARFPGIKLTTRFGDLEVAYDIELILGIERPDVLALIAEVELFEAGRPVRFMLGGYLNDEMRVGSGEIPVRRILDKPSLRASVSTRSRRPNVTPSLRMGPFSVRPPNKRVYLLVADDSGKTVERIKHEVTEESLLAISHGPRVPLTDVKPGRPYTLEASADMGLTIGSLTNRASFTTRSEDP